MTLEIEGPAHADTPDQTGNQTDNRSGAKRRTPTLRTGLIAAALLGVGIAGGAAVGHLGGPQVEMAPATPVAIASLKDDGGVTTVRGKVVELFGPMAVVADGSGRALVDLGRQGDGTGLVTVGSGVTVQGHYRHGMIRASFLVGAGGKVTALHPMGPPRGGPGGPDGGPRGRHGPHPGGPDGGPDGGPGDDMPPPPAPAAVAPAAPAATGNTQG